MAREILRAAIAGLVACSLCAQAQTLSQIGFGIGGGGGSSVSISANGLRVAIGAPDYHGSGKAHIFEYSDGAWSQLGEDIFGESSGNECGYSVSLSADGSRIAIGEPDWNMAEEYNRFKGRVRIFEYSNGSWVQLGADIRGTVMGDQLGESISLSAGGDRIAILSRNKNDKGQVRIFEYTSGGWGQLGQNIDGTVEKGSRYGSVSLSGDGSRVAFGMDVDMGSNQKVGMVRVFECSGGNWSQIGSVIHNEYVVKRSLSMNMEGSRLAVGCPSGLDFKGYVRVFEYSAGGWNTLGADIVGKADFDHFGRSASLSADGSRVAVGAPYNDDGGLNAGHARIFEYSDATWNQLGEDIEANATDIGEGITVSISADGNSVAVGRPFGITRVYQFNLISTTVIGSGTVNLPNGYYEPNTNLLLSATADPGWLFVGWSGDVVGDYTTASTNITVIGVTDITATFSDDADGDGLLNTDEYALGTDPRNADTDGDGLNDYDEVHTYFTDPTNPDSDADGLSDGEEILIYGSDPNKFDTDNDGFGDGFEVSTGFDPVSSNSTPDALSRILTAVEFQFNAAIGVSYRVEATANLSNTWEVVEAGILGQGGVESRLYSTEGEPMRFFRARRE